MMRAEKFKEVFNEAVDPTVCPLSRGCYNCPHTENMGDDFPECAKKFWGEQCKEKNL